MSWNQRDIDGSCIVRWLVLRGATAPRFFLVMMRVWLGLTFNHNELPFDPCVKRLHSSLWYRNRSDSMPPEMSFNAIKAKQGNVETFDGAKGRTNETVRAVHFFWRPVLTLAREEASH